MEKISKTYFVKFRLSGSDTDLVEPFEADLHQLVIPSFLMRYYGPSGTLTNPPGPEFVHVYRTDPNVNEEIKPIDKWDKPLK